MKANLDDLKPAEIVIIAKQSPEAVDILEGWVPGQEGDAEVDDGLDPVGPEQAEIPSGHSSPVVAHQEDLVDTQMIKKPNEIAHNVWGCVGSWGWWGVGVAEAAEVQSDSTVTEGREGEQLVAPRVPQVRKPVKEDHRRTCSD